MELLGGAAAILYLFMAGLLSLVCFLLALAIGIPTVLTIVQTIQKRGRWGINFTIPPCPECGTKPPTFRTPANARQALWGGWTCASCGTEMDKWGERVDDTVLGDAVLGDTVLGDTVPGDPVPGDRE